MLVCEEKPPGSDESWAMTVSTPFGKCVRSICRLVVLVTFQTPGPKVQKYSASETPARSSEDLRKGQNVINGLGVRFFAI